MPPPIFSDAAVRPRPPAPGPPAIIVIGFLWLTFACALPLGQLREARRQVREDLLHAFADGKLNNEGLVAVFEHSNQKLDAAASGPCLLFAFTSILLVNRMLRLRRRYHLLARDLSSSP